MYHNIFYNISHPTPPSVMSVDQQVKERLVSGVDTFLRQKKKEFQHYTPEDAMMMNEGIHSVEELLKEKLGKTYGVEEYLRKN